MLLKIWGLMQVLKKKVAAGRPVEPYAFQSVVRQRQRTPDVVGKQKVHEIADFAVSCPDSLSQ